MKNIKEYSELLIKKNDNGLILMNNKDGRIIYTNDAVRKILGEEIDKDALLEDVLGTELMTQPLTGETVRKMIDEVPVTIRTIRGDNESWIILEDNSELSDIEDMSKKIMSINNELINAFSEYSDDTIMIVDGDGTIEYAGKAIADTCGMDAVKFIGKSVYNLEKEGVFTPSVSVKILETQKPQAVIQTTLKGVQLLSVGAPIIDENGEIEKVVSLTRGYDNQIKLSKLIGELKGNQKQGLKQDEEVNDQIVTCNDKMFEIKTLARMIAPTDATVLIVGETGTGKEVIAKYIYSLSDRKDKPFIKVNCGTISHSIAESELFGYEEGSFTGANKGGKIGLIEAANGGTLFLDEIGELPMEQQVKLLHVLQERVLTRVGGVKSIDLNIRIIAATNKDLVQEVKNGKFREDLYYRLNVIPISIPPLCKRTEDIPLLARYFLKKYCKEYGKEIALSKKASDQLCRYSWPGNIRQLENTMERLVLTTIKHSIVTSDLPEEIRDIGEENEIKIPRIMKLSEAIENVEKELLEMAYKEYGTTVRIAEALGINQSTVSRKLTYYKIRKDKDNEE